MEYKMHRIKTKAIANYNLNNSNQTKAHYSNQTVKNSSNNNRVQNYNKILITHMLIMTDWIDLMIHKTDSHNKDKIKIMCLVLVLKLSRNQKVPYLWVELQYKIKKIKLNLRISWNHSRVWHQKWSNNMIKREDNKNVFKNKLFNNLRHRRSLKIY